MKRSRKILELKQESSSKYHSIDLDKLVMYAISKLDEMDAELSVENIIVATYKIFPRKFSLIGYPEFPDNSRIEKSLWRCKGKRRGWLEGKTSHAFALTEKGRLITSRAKALLSGESVGKRTALSQGRRKERIISEVIQSTAFKKFGEKKRDSISEFEVCYVLQGTLDSPKQTLRENLTLMQRIAEEMGQEPVRDFLTFLQSRFSHFLSN